MRSFYCFLLMLLLIGGQASPQGQTCRPRVCMVMYQGHNDQQSNPVMAAILSARPEILIDNTPGGYWGGGCLPSIYNASGTKVFSYITGGYEGTKYHSSEDNLTSNLARIDAIATDGAAGVFLDEVTSFPNQASRDYISAVNDKCRARGLQLIVNPGIWSFDPWLMDHADLLMSDEHYNGNRLLTSSEKPFADRILVVAQEGTSGSQATSIHRGAQSNGFGYAYVCSNFLAVDSWLLEYMQLLTQTPRPAAPVITLNGSALVSSAPDGNHWYGITTGAIANANLSVFQPTASDTYYSVLNLSGCSSASSNTVNFIITASPSLSGPGPVSIFFSYDSHTVNVRTGSNENPTSIDVVAANGVVVYSARGVRLPATLSLPHVSAGWYLVRCWLGNKAFVSQVFISN